MTGLEMLEDHRFADQDCELSSGEEQNSENKGKATKRRKVEVPQTKERNRKNTDPFRDMKQWLKDVQPQIERVNNILEDFDKLVTEI
eukprot:CAMPEP_0174273058 /NCGR_PEP_ID=MMETSP0439-20130205/53224_1 /TAXON_ID=0 /ORGANISM="Stereomyxa ramosa, Strain Chinc5" /LENGTH=86 /DNA_ID=CAMNT_0015363971 /DNA_START=91 /DNA_END=351 /DNA_ORIENTATION=+